MALEDDVTVIETVAVFKTADSLQGAIDDLMMSGFDRADLSLLGAEKSVEEKLGHSYRTVAELEDDESVPRTFYVAPEAIGDAEGALIAAPLYVAALGAAIVILAYGGRLVVAIAGSIVAGGAGALIGVFLAKKVGGHHARYIREQLAHGGLLLWVRTRNVRSMKRAVAILFNHAGRDVHVHMQPRSV